MPVHYRSRVDSSGGEGVSFVTLLGSRTAFESIELDWSVFSQPSSISMILSAGLTLCRRNTCLSREFFFSALPWLRRSVAGMSPRRPGVDSRSVFLRLIFFVTFWHWDRFFSQCFCFPLTISFLQGPVLIC